MFEVRVIGSQERLHNNELFRTLSEFKKIFSVALHS